MDVTQHGKHVPSRAVQQPDHQPRGDQRNLRRFDEVTANGRPVTHAALLTTRRYPLLQFPHFCSFKGHRKHRGSNSGNLKCIVSLVRCGAVINFPSSKQKTTCVRDVRHGKRRKRVFHHDHSDRITCVTSGAYLSRAFGI